MTNTFTTQQREKLEIYLSEHQLSWGVGTRESACSIAAINLAIDGRLTDDIPDCMSDVIGNVTIVLQDDMPDEMRNSERYEQLLPDMAGTGRDHERERLEIVLDWMWGTVLPQLQPVANTGGFGEEWAKMCEDRTKNAADVAAAAAYAAAYAAHVADPTSYTLDAARAASYAARAASYALEVAG